MKNQNSKTENFFRVLTATILISLFLYLFIGFSAQAEDEVATSTPATNTVTTTESGTSTTEETPGITETAETTPSAALNIRYEDTMIYSGQIPLVTTTYYDTVNGINHDLFGTSTVFSTLVNADKMSEMFAITDAVYNSDWDSFYLRCLTFETTTTTVACDNWNYTVDGIYPSVGLDKYLLQGGESIYLYFSTPWQITASTSTFPIGATTTLQTWRYQSDNLQNPWTTDGNDTIDISVTNPDSTGWWDANLTIATITSASLGTVDYLFASTGTFFARIAPPDYSKWSNPITITVTDAPTVATTTSTDQTTQSGGVGGSPIDKSISATEINDAVNKILNYLKSQQATDGKIIDGGITDWAIMAFAANGEYADDIKNGDRSLLDFARAYNFTDASDLNICASYPRHILALLAAGVSVDDNQIMAMSGKIESAECYQNNKYGLDGVNDDVFALIALTAVGAKANETIITDIIAAILADQNADGASTWAGWAGVDITGATVNALAYAQKNGSDISNDFFDRAKNYLRNQQTADGGWGDPLSTGWAMMGINALGEGQNQWYNSASKNPWHSLVNNLNSAGYYESVWMPGTVDWFATKHAVPALLGKYWPIILPARQNVNFVPAANGSPIIIVTSTLISPPATPLTTSSPSSSLLMRIQPNLIDYSFPSSTEIIATTTEAEAVAPTLTIATAETPKATTSPRTEPTRPTSATPIEPTAVTSPSPTIGEPTTDSLETSGFNEIANYSELKPTTSTTVKIAKGIFGGSVALGGGLGLYLGWRFLQSLL
ncbi:MAG: hypothetical protein AAB390_02665 [Patescibacteria group bacterium]